MSQSLAKVLVHLIYSTKDRRPVLEEMIRDELHRYSAVILQDLSSPALIINSVADHIHLLLNLHRTRTLSDLVMEVKRGSSKWIKTKGPQFALFQWQNGYGAFSVSQSAVPDVYEYIRKREEHHRKVTFQEEFRCFLQRHDVPFDERYVWD